MLWRVWTFLVGTPLGVLALWALPFEADLGGTLLAAGLGGAALAGAASLAERLGAHEPDRGRHLAIAATAALAGLPALGAAWLGLAPGPGWSLGALVAVLALLLARAARAQGTAGSERRGAVAAGLAVAGGSVLWVGLAGVLAAFGPGTPEPSEEQAHYVYDVDAKVASRPLPRCEGVARVRVLLERGAHPRLGPEGRVVWLDAPGPEGRRQVHRLDRETRELRCLTCGEAGENRRPAPHPRGAVVAFDTDRHATALHPANTEIHWKRTGPNVSDSPSRRLTRAPGPDERALFDPGGSSLVWSRGHRGRFDVVAAPLQGGHGGLLLGGPALLVGGGARWVAPLGWSPDARALAVASGHPYRPAAVRVIDPATGRSRELAETIAPVGAVGFSADGAWMAVATTRGRGAFSMLPRSLGFLLGRVRASASEEGAPTARRTGLRTGPTGEAGAPLELGALADWGAPTGVALLPDGEGLVLGQRRAEAPRERIVELALDCAGAAARTAGEPGG